MTYANSLLRLSSLSRQTQFMMQRSESKMPKVDDGLSVVEFQLMLIDN